MQNNEHPKSPSETFPPKEKIPQKTTPLDHHPRQPQQQHPDLNLRLSLGEIYNGKYKEKLLARSTSINGAGDITSSIPKSFLSLSRTCSLPASDAEQWWRSTASYVDFAGTRKSVQQKCSRAVLAEDLKIMAPVPVPAAEPMPTSPSKVPAWAATSAARNPAFCRAMFKMKLQACLAAHGQLEGAGMCRTGAPQAFPMQEVALSDFTTLPVGKGRSVAESNGWSSPYKKCKLTSNEFEDNGINVMKQMPGVSAMGDGPNGKRIEGVLYNYMKGQVCIVCVCHGRFLTPAEFIKHAGGNDVENPMRHITVCPTTSSSSF